MRATRKLYGSSASRRSSRSQIALRRLRQSSGKNLPRTMPSGGLGRSDTFVFGGFEEGSLVGMTGFYRLLLSCS